mmetsp:Transcript_6065/g.14945  ORF Transcript_6065/g.14945 Transcript_6065/m.14945 type:complete len:192 (+) Transcript_6065:360-935(+)
MGGGGGGAGGLDFAPNLADGGPRLINASDWGFGKLAATPLPCWVSASLLDEWWDGNFGKGGAMDEVRLETDVFPEPPGKGGGCNALDELRGSCGNAGAMTPEPLGNGGGGRALCLRDGICGSGGAADVVGFEVEVVDDLLRDGRCGNGGAADCVGGEVELAGGVGGEVELPCFEGVFELAAVHSSLFQEAS